MKILILALAVIFTTSCATIAECKQPAHALEAKCIAINSVIDCTTPAAASMISQFKPLLEGAVQHATSGDGGIDLPSIKAVTASLATDDAKCVAAAVFHAAVRRLADPNAPKSSPLVADPIMLKAGFESIRTEQFGGKTFRLPEGSL